MRSYRFPELAVLPSAGPRTADPPDAEAADRALTVKAALFDALAITVHRCGGVALG